MNVSKFWVCFYVESFLFLSPISFTEVSNSFEVGIEEKEHRRAKQSHCLAESVEVRQFQYSEPSQMSKVDFLVFICVIWGSSPPTPTPERSLGQFPGTWNSGPSFCPRTFTPQAELLGKVSTTLLQLPCLCISKVVMKKYS